MSRTHLNIKTGDTVLVLAGKDRGKRGKVIQVFPQLRKVVVEGVNQMTKNVRSRNTKDKGQKVQFNGPIHISNVMFIDPQSNHPTRLGRTTVGDKRVRRSVRSRQPITA